MCACKTSGPPDSFTLQLNYKAHFDDSSSSGRTHRRVNTYLILPSSQTSFDATNPCTAAVDRLSSKWQAYLLAITWVRSTGPATFLIGSGRRSAITALACHALVGHLGRARTRQNEAGRNEFEPSED